MTTSLVAYYTCLFRPFRSDITSDVRARILSSLVTLSVAAVAGVLILQVLRTGGMPNPLSHGDFGARILDIAVLVFREGLECILVLAAVTTWWVLLIGYALLTLTWGVYLILITARPAWLLRMWGTRGQFGPHANREAKC